MYHDGARHGLDYSIVKLQQPYKSSSLIISFTDKDLKAQGLKRVAQGYAGKFIANFILNFMWTSNLHSTPVSSLTKVKLFAASLQTIFITSS